MIPHRIVRISLLAMLIVVPIALVAVGENQPVSHWPSGQLTPQEETLARSLAERELFKSGSDIQAGERIYFTRLQFVPDSQAESNQREVIVTHYRYRGNQAILTHVDLNAHTVLSVDRVDNLPTPLAPEEYRRAVELARADARLQDLFADHEEKLHIEAKLSWPAQVDDVTQPHRNVHLLFRSGRDYLSGPRVVVDLVNEEVLVEKSSS